MIHKLPIVAVFGRGAPVPEERATLARQLGAMVARLGAHLLTGGGYGVMAAAGEGFVAIEPRVGLSLGIVPRHPDGPFDRPNEDMEGRVYPNPFVEVAVMTPLLSRVENWRDAPSRNHVNVFTADAMIALPGGVGTSNELDMAAYYHNAAAEPRGGKVILFGPADEFDIEHREAFFHTILIAEAEREVRRILGAVGFALASAPRTEPSNA